MRSEPSCGGQMSPHSHGFRPAPNWMRGNRYCIIQGLGKEALSQCKPIVSSWSIGTPMGLSTKHLMCDLLCVDIPMGISQQDIIYQSGLVHIQRPTEDNQSLLRSRACVECTEIFRVVHLDIVELDGHTEPFCRHPRLRLCNLTVCSLNTLTLGASFLPYLFGF